MPQRLELEAETFLPTAYRENLNPVREQLRTIEFPSDPDATPFDIASSSLMRQLDIMGSTAAFIKGEAKQVPKRPNSPEEMRSFLQFSALKNLHADLSLRSIRNVFAMLTAHAELHEDYEVALNSHAAGESVINGRANFNAAAILATSAYLHDPHPHGDQATSSWQRAIDAHKRTGKPAPVTISEQEGVAFSELLTKVRRPSGKVAPKPIFKVTGSKTLNLARAGIAAGKLVWQGVRTLNDIIEVADHIVGESLDASVVELEPEEIVRSMRTAVKVRRYLASAAVVDRSILTDPIALAVVFHGQELGAHDIKSEHAVFVRDTRKIVKHQRTAAFQKFAKRGAVSSETPGFGGTQA